MLSQTTPTQTPIMKNIILSASTKSRALAVAAGLFSACLSVPSRADTFTWTADGTGGPSWNWNDASKWSPASIPNASDADVAFSITGGSPGILLDGAYTVNNFSVTADGGRNISFASINTAGSYSLTVAGALSKNNGSSSVSFYDYNLSRYLNLTVGALDFTNTGGGNFYFGRSDGGRTLHTLALGSVNMGAGDTATAVLDFNIAGNYSLGLVTFSGTNTKSVYLINNASANAGYTRTATVKGLVQTGGTAATIYGSSRTAASGSNAATLQIDTDAATTYVAGAILADGTGGTPTLDKTGDGAQTLTGANTYTGGTLMEGGTLATGATGAFGLGDVRLTGGTLLLGNASSIADTATLSFTASSFVSLSFTGTEIVGQIVDSSTHTTLSSGTYTAAQLNSYFGVDSVFSGDGLVQIGAAIPEPSACAGVLGLLALGGALVRRRFFRVRQTPLR